MFRWEGRNKDPNLVGPFQNLVHTTGYWWITTSFKQTYQIRIPLLDVFPSEDDKHAQFYECRGLNGNYKRTLSKSPEKLTAIYHRRNPLMLAFKYVVDKLHYYYSHVNIFY